MNTKEQKTIASTTEYVDFIDKLKLDNEKSGNNVELLFRGQSTDEPLLPKIARLVLRINTNSIAKTEELILEEFRRGILPLAEFQPEDNWDLLSLAQHHGLPTRLLDWTYNALAALWFTVNKTPKKNKEGELLDGVVWILSGDVKDFRTDKIDPLKNKVTKIFRPRVISRRISAQGGVFTVHMINDNGRMYRFETNRSFQKKLIKLIVPADKFSVIRKQLNILGINNFTLFPDLDGFSSHLKWRFSKYPDEK